MIAQYFDNFGFTKHQFKIDELIPLKEEILYIEKNFDAAVPYNSGLLGNIRREYALQTSVKYLESLVLPYANGYIQHFYKNKMQGNSKLFLKSAWVNFQKKYEFNPMHMHSGLLSFVLWIKIPYDMKTELQLSPGVNAAENMAGSFNFIYTDTMGGINTHKIEADKSMENTLIIFPAEMRHCVYPFYSSDEHRISVSGNFFAE
jgi:hypothetical protein